MNLSSLFNRYGDGMAEDRMAYDRMAGTEWPRDRMSSRPNGLTTEWPHDRMARDRMA